MKIREIVAASHIPYRKVVFGVLTVCSIGIYVPFWLPLSWHFLYYIFIPIALLGVLYIAFWVYKSGYKKQALLMTIFYIALFTITIMIFKWAYDGLSDLQSVIN